jgi:formiminotetrahydrofolate cyclodeaminase
MPTPESLFAEVVEVTGVSTIVARSTIQRALATVKASIETATEEDYVEAMPQLRQKLAPFVDREALGRLEKLEHRLAMRAGMISARIQLHLENVKSD